MFLKFVIVIESKIFDFVNIKNYFICIKVSVD